MKLTTRIAWNAVTRWGAVGIQGAIALILVPFLLNPGQLGTAGYGIVGLVGVIVSFTMMADLGLSQALARHVAEQIARKDVDRCNELLTTATTLFLLVGLLGACACVALAPYLARIFKVPAELMPQALFVIRWYGGPMILISFLSPTTAAILIGNNRFDLSNLIATGAGIVTGLALFLVLGLTRSGLYGYTCVCVTCWVLRLLTRSYVSYRVWPVARISLRRFRLDALKHLFSLGSQMFLIRMAERLSVQANPIVITRFFGPAGVGLYRPGGSLPRAGRPLVTALASQLVPLATGYHAMGKTRELQAILIRGTRYTFLMGIPLCVILVTFAMPIMRLYLGRVLGPDYRIPALIMMGWAVADLAFYAGGSQSAVLLGMNRVKFLVWAQLSGAILAVITAIVLVGYTRLGLVGAVVPAAVIAVIRWPVLVVHTARATGMTAGRYFAESYFRPMLVLAALVLVALGLQFTLWPRSLPAVIGCAGGVACLWVPLCWWLGFNRADRASFWAMLRPALARIPLLCKMTNTDA